jgi:ATP-dependent RNA helicase DeaD
MMPERKNLALLSATISREVMDIAWIYQRDAVEITVPEDTANKPDIKQYSIEAAGSAKLEGIIRIMDAENYERVLIFCNTKQMVERLSKTLRARGFSADCIHGDIRQSIREKVMSLFRSGTLRILVATDVAARGIDIDDVDAVFNYDMPAENEYYIHRIGRTGRAKKHGVAYSFVSYYDAARLKDIIRYTNSDIIPMKFDKNRKLVPDETK